VHDEVILVDLRFLWTVPSVRLPLERGATLRIWATSTAARAEPIPGMPRPPSNPALVMAAPAACALTTSQLMRQLQPPERPEWDVLLPVELRRRCCPRSSDPLPDELRRARYPVEHDRWRGQCDPITFGADRADQVGADPILHRCDFDAVDDLVLGEFVAAC
jgi:hypothetical protein